jgi:hypothetical protein
MHGAQMTCAGVDLMPTLEETLHSNLYFGRFDLLFYGALGSAAHAGRPQRIEWDLLSSLM